MPAEIQSPVSKLTSRLCPNAPIGSPEHRAAARVASLHTHIMQECAGTDGKQTERFRSTAPPIYPYTTAEQFHDNPPPYTERMPICEEIA
jgi:hypothetical protein